MPALLIWTVSYSPSWLPIYILTSLIGPRCMNYFQSLVKNVYLPIGWHVVAGYSLWLLWSFPEFTCNLRLSVNRMSATKIKTNALPLKPTCCKRHKFVRRQTLSVSPFSVCTFRTVSLSFGQQLESVCRQIGIYHENYWQLWLVSIQSNHKESFSETNFTLWLPATSDNQLPTTNWWLPSVCR